MGTGRTQSKARAHAKKKCYKRGHSTKCRARDIDQIQDDIKNQVESGKGKDLTFEKDEDLPGLGQFYCTPCARHFVDEYTKNAHVKSKLHKRRLKDIAQEQYTQEEADRGAGKVREILPPAHPVVDSVC